MRKQVKIEVNKDKLERKTLLLMLSPSITRTSSFFTKLELELNSKNYKKKIWKRKLKKS